MTHEVTEVTTGYRWVLTYNLVNKSPGKQPLAAAVRSDLQELHAAFKSWQKDEDRLGYDKFIHILKHKYTDASLRLNNLKAKDLVAAQALQEVCSHTDCTLFLASCEREVFGGCEDEYGYDYSERYNDRYYDDEGDETEESEEEDGYHDLDSEHEPRCSTSRYHSIIDVCADSLSLKRVVDLDGVTVAEDLSIAEADFIEDSPFEDRDPDDEDYSGFTGNEGVSATHWYQDSVSSRIVFQFLPRSN